MVCVKADRDGGCAATVTPATRASVGAVLRTSERSSVLGYDIVVAAPRPASILLALDAEHGAGVVAAHRASVASAIDYLEEHALVVRDRRGGEDRDLAGRWTGVVGFTHGVNRHGEPHLHDHVLVGALPEGSRNVLDSRGLFAHLEAADALYRTSLRHELARTNAVDGVAVVRGRRARGRARRGLPGAVGRSSRGSGREAAVATSRRDRAVARRPRPIRIAWA